MWDLPGGPPGCVSPGSSQKCRRGKRLSDTADQIRSDRGGKAVRQECSDGRKAECRFSLKKKKKIIEGKRGGSNPL